MLLPFSDSKYFYINFPTFPISLLKP